MTDKKPFWSFAVAAVAVEILLVVGLHLSPVALFPVAIFVVS